MTFHLVVETCEKGFRITVENIPSEGLDVGIGTYLLGKCILPWIVQREVTQSNPTAIFSNLTSGSYCIQIWNKDGNLVNEKQNISPPTTGCKIYTLNGFDGALWYILLTSSKAYVKPNDSFQLKAVLKRTPNILQGANMPIDFFKGTEKIWSTVTDENGVAVCTRSESEVGTYKYTASYTDQKTYLEPIGGATVEVTETPPSEGLWATILKWIMDTFGVDEKTANIIVIAMIGLIVLLIVSMFKK